MNTLPPNIHSGNIFNSDIQSQMTAITIPETLETRFGVELETCIRIDPDCIPEFTGVDLNKLLFKEKFDMYFKYFLAPYCQENTEFANKYRFAGIISTATNLCSDREPEYFIYSLTEPFIIEDGVGKINYHRASGDELNMLWDYIIPIFEYDCTLECGDVQEPYIGVNNPFNEEINNILVKNRSIGIECITPILSIKGKATRTKIYNALNEMLQFFGLGRKPIKCFIPNFSTGFHVNMSVFDTISDKYYYLSSYKFYAYLLEIFTIYESQYYRHIRTRKPVRANKTVKKNWISTWAQPIYPIYDMFRTKSDDITQQYINSLPTQMSLNDQRKLRSQQFRDKIIQYDLMTGSGELSGKFRSIMKKGNVLEFRLFQSDRDINKLLEYTFMTAKIVQDSLKYYAVLNGSVLPTTDIFTPRANNVPRVAIPPPSYGQNVNINEIKMPSSLHEWNNATENINGSARPRPIIPISVEIEELLNNNENTGAGVGLINPTPNVHIEEVDGGYRMRRRHNQSKKLKKSNRKRHTKRRK